MSTDDIVKKIAKLACLKLEGEELKKFSKEFTSILEYVNKLDKVDVSKIEPMSHVHGSTNVFRDDELKEHLDTSLMLANAPDKSGRFIRVPIVIQE